MDNQSPGVFYFGAEMKQCARCKEWKEFSEFYEDKGKKLGVSSYCKACCKNYNHTNGKENLKKYRQTEGYKERAKIYAREYRKTFKNQLYRKDYRTKYEKNNPEMVKARAKVKREIKQGRFQPANSFICSICNQEQAYDYHHYLGYDPIHWLDILPICRRCHINIHKAMAQ